VAACAKAADVAVLLVGHVTKDGAIAGPRTLEHMVDVVLYLEGDRLGDHRLLRGIKNRFGSTGELGLLTMDAAGIRELEAPGRAFIDGGSLDVAGSVLAVTCEGRRPIAVEVQALTVKTSYGLPRRTASGFDPGRLHLLLGLLERRAGLRLGQHDVFVNVVGGVRIADPGVDLAVALAIAGSTQNRRVPTGAAVVGELGLAGEVRRVRALSQRLSEAAALGLESMVVPAAQLAPHSSTLRLLPVATVAEAVGVLVA
jgi:DNA repair protein RadA/Sms